MAVHSSKVMELPAPTQTNSPAQGQPVPPVARGFLRRHPWLLPITMVIALGATIGSWVGARVWQVRKTFAAAHAALADYRFEDASRELYEYLRHRPGDAEAHFLLAQACRRTRKQDFAAARHHVAEARRLGYPVAALGREELFLRFQATGEPGADEQDLLHLLAGHPADEPLIRETLVRGYLNATRPKEALAQLSDWISRFPDDWYAHLWRGAVYQVLPRPGLAVADYERVLKLHPGDPWVERNLGLMLVQGNGDFEEARAYLQAALQRDPSDADARVGLASCWRALEKPAIAKPLLEQVLAHHPDHVDGLLTLALVDLDLDQPAQALAPLKHAEPLIGHTDFHATLARLAHLEVPANNAEEVKHVLAVTHLLGTALRKLGRDQEAAAYEQHYTQVRRDFAAVTHATGQVGKGQPPVTLARKIGLLYNRVGMGDYGESWLQMVVDKDPHDRQASQTLADYYRGRKGAEAQRLSRQYQAIADAAK